MQQSKKSTKSAFFGPLSLDVPFVETLIFLTLWRQPKNLSQNGHRSAESLFFLFWFVFLEINSKQGPITILCVFGDEWKSG